MPAAPILLVSLSGWAAIPEEVTREMVILDWIAHPRWAYSMQFRRRLVADAQGYGLIQAAVVGEKVGDEVES